MAEEGWGARRHQTAVDWPLSAPDPRHLGGSRGLRISLSPGSVSIKGARGDDGLSVPCAQQMPSEHGPSRPAGVAPHCPGDRPAQGRLQAPGGWRRVCPGGRAAASSPRAAGCLIPEQVGAQQAWARGAPAVSTLRGLLKAPPLPGAAVSGASVSPTRGRGLGVPCGRRRSTGPETGGSAPGASWGLGHASSPPGASVSPPGEPGLAQVVQLRLPLGVWGPFSGGAHPRICENEPVPLLQEEAG